MKYLRIFFIFIVIYPMLSYSADSFDVKMKSHTNESSIPTDSVSLIDNNNILGTDSITTVYSFKPLQQDTTKLKEIELQKNPGDTTNLFKNVPLINPTDSIGLIQVEKKIESDSLKIIQPFDNDSSMTFQPLINDSLKIIKVTPKDSIPRMQYRSVYVDSVEQGNPNFMPKKVIEIKWISEKRDTVIRYKNIIGLNLFYGSYIYGFGAGIYKRLSNDADFIANINFDYVFDSRTASDLDSNGNMTDLEHESRIYTITFNVGLEKYFLQNRTSWKIKPVLIFGFTPTIIFSTPYSLKMFQSFKKIQLSYGVGLFAALGFDYQAFNTVGINLTARYAFTPVLFGKDVYYYKGFKVKNVGGFYVNLGVTLLKPYFSRK
jgi:hypothetical protein